MQQLVAELTRPVVLSDRALRHVARLKQAHHDAGEGVTRMTLRNRGNRQVSLRWRRRSTRARCAAPTKLIYGV